MSRTKRKTPSFPPLQYSAGAITSSCYIRMVDCFALSQQWCAVPPQGPTRGRHRNQVCPTHQKVPPLPDTSAISILITFLTQLTLLLYHSAALLLYLVATLSSPRSYPFMCSRMALLPPKVIILSWRSVQESRVSERTWEKCTPRERCSPLHERHKKMPLLIEAQCGERLPMVSKESVLTTIEALGVFRDGHKLLEHQF